MAKGQKQLSQAEVWDDSALLKSWDDALQEYKLYHSIHARGERVEDVLREAQERIEVTGKATPLDMDDSVSVGHGAGNGSDELEDGELGESIEKQGGNIGKPSSTIDSEHPIQSAEVADKAGGQGIPTVPDKVMSNVKDEALKNLMMSWYYAGYYTGLYEGQKQTAPATTQDQTDALQGGS